MSRWLARVETRNAVFGFEVGDRRVSRCAPYGRRLTMGRTGRDAVQFWQDRGATVTWTPINSVQGDHENLTPTRSV